MVGAPVRREQARFAKSRGVSLRRACALLGTSRSALAYESRLALADAPAVAKMRALSRKHPRWGHRFIRVLLARAGMPMSRGRALRLWRSAGLCLPRRRPRRRRGGIDTPRVVATKPNEVWALDFVFDWCAGGKKLKCLTLVDELNDPRGRWLHSSKHHDRLMADLAAGKDCVIADIVFVLREKQREIEDLVRSRVPDM